MNILDKINIRKSFTAKICFWMLGTTACVFIVCFGIALYFASDMMLNDGHRKANLELDKAILYVTDEINTIECAGNNFAAFLNKDRHLTPDQLYAACQDFLRTNPVVTGVAIGFEPGQYPEYSKGFAPYVMRTGDDKFITNNLSNFHNF